MHQVAARRQASNKHSITAYDSTPKKCIINGGKAIAHDKDPDFASRLTGIIEFTKLKYDTHELPDIQIVEPSFYFQTTDPRPNGKNWPALSRAWNDTYAVIDSESVINAESDIWGSSGLEDPIIRQAMDADSENDDTPIRILPPGKYVTFSGWFVGNFGHFIHDHVSKIAWLKSLVSDDTIFLLPYHKLHESILNTVDETFVKERIVWVQYDETVHVKEEGSLTVMIPKTNHPFRSGYPQTATIYTEHFRRWLKASHWAPDSKPKAKNTGKVIFYTRKGTTDRRVVDSDLEELLIATTREAMVKRGQKGEDLVIFSGGDGEGNTLPMQEQFELFSSADTVIGPHGSGLTNIIWMDPGCDSKNRPKVLEFASSYRTTDVQAGSHWGYWFLFGSLPWIDYHQMYYTENSNDGHTFVDPETFKETLNSMWNIR